MLFRSERIKIHVGSALTDLGDEAPEDYVVHGPALLGAKGIMLNIFDMMGNGINEDWGYGKMLADIKPFVSALANHRLNMKELRGIKVLVDQDSAYTAHTTLGKDPEELLPHEKNWASLLASFSFATTILPIQDNFEIKNQTDRKSVV